MKKFVMTKDWLTWHYGSMQTQIEQTKQWLQKYGTDITNQQLQEWSLWKHLAEYQVNTLDIVPRVVGRIGEEFESELHAHRFINLLRVPLSACYDETVQKVKPKSILELGVGGDSAISTSIFLAWAEAVEGKVDSVDINPLGRTWGRYKDYVPKLWSFTQTSADIHLVDLIKAKKKYDMVFIDTSHAYNATLLELGLAAQVSDNILMDDAKFEGNANDPEPGGVRRAIEEWSLGKGSNWELTKLWGGDVAFFSKK